MMKLSTFIFETSHLTEVILEKLRINVVILSSLITWIIIDFGNKLIHLLHDEETIDPQLIITVLVGLISVGTGGLIAAMMRMFEPAQVPAEVHERVIKGLLAEIKTFLELEHNAVTIEDNNEKIQ